MDVLPLLAATSSAASQSTVGSTRIRVVIVDDCPDVRFLLATVIELDSRFEVVAEASDAERALASVAATKPDLVLIDLHLRGSRGASVIRDLREQGVTACVVVVSGSATFADRSAALHAGANAIQGKNSMTSTMVDELAALVSLHGERAMGENRSGPKASPSDAGWLVVREIDGCHTAALQSVSARRRWGGGRRPVR